MHSGKMKRKVAKVGHLRLSPNEEALLVKEEVERRRKLRLQQVREQERYIASQIREDVKHRRDEQLHHLAEELKAEWQEVQVQKIKALEKAYLSSLRAVGEGHRHAKENEPDLSAIARQVAVCNQRAEKRHREALKELKHQRESQLKQQSWHIRARKQALHMEKERAAKIASLPAPPPDPFESIEAAKRTPAVKIYDVDSFSGTHYHLPEPYVDREMDTEQPDARLAAEEEAKRLEELHNEDEREKREQLEKAQLRGHHALKMVHLTQDREQLLKELEQMQQDDLCRRRQAVAQMPPQLFTPAYRRVEMREDWQRELEFAFEDMYTGDQKVKGDLILQLEPEPLPAPSVGTQDDELDLSIDRGHVCPTKHSEDEETETIVQPADGSRQPQSKLVLSKLLNRIRSQKGQLTSTSELASVSETIESGSLASEEKRLDPGSIAEQHGRPEEHHAPETTKPPDIGDTTVIAGNSILLHPQEQASRVRIAAERQRQVESLEQQKRHQLALLQQLEQQRISLQENFQNAQLRMQESSRREMEEQSQPALQAHMNAEDSLGKNVEFQQMKEAGPGPEVASCEDDHLMIIRNYQQRLLQQNKQHKESVEEARKRLQDYQIMLKKRYPFLSTSSVDPTISAESQCTDLKPSAGPLSEASETVHRRLSPGRNTQFEPVHFKENTEPLSSNLTTSILQKESKRILQLQRPDDYPCEPVQQYRTPQEHFQQRFTSLEPEPMFSVLCTPLDSEIRQSPGTCNRSASVVLPSQSISVVPQSEADVQWIRPNLPQEYVGSSGTCASDHRPDVEFWKNLDAQKPAAAQRSEKELVHNLPEACNVPIVSCEPVANLQHQKTQRSGDVPNEQSNTQPSVVHEPPSTLFCGESFRKGTAYDQWVHQSGAIPLPDLSNAVEFQQKLLASSEEIQVQQDHLKQLQLQLDQQREMLLLKQRAQEQSLLQKQNDLKAQMQRQQEALLGFLRDQQTAEPDEQSDTQEDQQLQLMSSLLNSLESSCQQDFNLQDTSRRFLGREHRWRSSKPPVTKTKLGPIVEQHELSAIQELESPRSGRPSFTGRKDVTSSGGEASFMALVCDPNYSRSSSDASHHDTDLSRVSTSSRDQSYGESTSGSSRLSWRERLTLETASSHSSGQSPDSELMKHAPSYAADVGEGATYPDPNHKPSEDMVSLAWPASSYSLPSHSVEALGDYLSSTTISTGSFLTIEKVDTSPGDTETSSYSAGQCSSSYTRGSISSFMSLPASLSLHPPLWQENMSENQELQAPAEEHQSQIQRIIDKYTKDLNWSFERNVSFQAHPVGFDFSHLNDDSFNRHSFHLLDPKPDFDCSIKSVQQPNKTPHFQDLEDLSKSSVFSTKSQEPCIYHPSPPSSIQQNSSSLVSSVRTGKSNSPTSPVGASSSENILIAPGVGFDFSRFENHSFSCPSFHLLEPKPDFDPSALSFQHSDRTLHLRHQDDLSKSSDFSTKSQDSLVSHRSPSSSVAQQSAGTAKSHSTKWPVGDCGMGNISLEVDSSESFYQLHPELTLGEQNLSATESVSPTTRSARSSNHSVESITYATPREHFSPPVGEQADKVTNTEDLPNSQPFVETLRSQSASSFQENASFYELDVTEHTVNNSLLSEHPMKDCKGKAHEDCSSFEKLTVNTDQVQCPPEERAIPATYSMERAHRHLDVATSEDQSRSLSKQHSNPQLQSKTPVQAIIETVGWTSDPDRAQITSSFGNSGALNSISACSHVSGTTLLQSSIPIWDTESGRGIMEEPELTLLSLNDSCVTVPDLEQVNREENGDGNIDILPCLTDDSELKSCSWQQNGLASLIPEADTSMFTLPDSSSQGVKSPSVDPSSSQRYAVMQLDFPSSLGNLQEAFFKKKQDFIQQSSKRLEEIKTKERLYNKIVPKKETSPLPLQMEPSSCSESLSAEIQLKKVAEVKVCTPEDRKTAEVQMHQRTLRLYNQLDEVKNRKTEKMRQESYAKNRGKAKEFHKKTLEKLRAK